jgi:hypothetical protein
MGVLIKWGFRGVKVEFCPTFTPHFPFPVGENGSYAFVLR